MDPSVLEAPTQSGPRSDSTPFREERTKLIAWPKPEHEDSVPDAVILGDVNIAEDEFAVVHGAGAEQDGRTSTFLFYAAGSTTRVVHPDAIPRRLEGDTTLPRTPYEDFVLSCIDGKRSVRDIQRASGLAPQEVAVTLLTLLDKNAVEIIGPSGAPGALERPKKPKAKANAPETAAPRREIIAPSLSASDADEDDLSMTQTLEREGLKKPRATPLPEDFDELPSVSDFEDVGLEATRGESVTKEPRLPSASERAKRPAISTRARAPARSSSMSDVWSEASISGADAEALIENVELVDDAPDDRPLVQPSELDADDSEEATRELQLTADPPQRVKVSRSEVSRPISGPRSTPVPSLLESLAPKPDPPGKGRHTKPPSNPAILDPAFLEEVPPSSIAPLPSLDAPEEDEITGSPKVSPYGKSTSLSVEDPALKDARKRALAAAVKRGPVQEKQASQILPRARAPETGPQPPVKPEPAPRSDPVARPIEVKAEPKSPKSDGVRADPKGSRAEVAKAAAQKTLEPVDAQRMLKAQKLFEQALKDKSEGNLVSARMNMKLALTFDPANELYNTSFEELSKNPDAKPKGVGGGAIERGRDLYNAATEAENQGDVDRAIQLLWNAIDESKQAAFYNRLGVILAMKKHEFVRAQELVEKAIDIAPGNHNYEKNLQKILSMAATISVNNQAAGAGKKGGILGFLGRKK